MTMQGCVRTLALCGALGSICGCAGIPPAPVGATAPPPRPGSISGVVQTSAEEAATPLPPTGDAAQGAAKPAGRVPVYPPPGPAVVPEPAKKPNGERADTGFDLEKLAPESLYKGIKSAAGYGPNETFARDTFAEGEKLFQEKKYKEAAAKFATAADRWPDSLLEEDAMFMQAESYFFSDKYSSAHDTYANLLKKYDNSRYLDTAVKREFTMGRYWEQMHDKSPHWPVTPNLTDKTLPWFDTYGHAIDCYRFVFTHDPTGPLADDAVMATARSHFMREEWEEAARYFDMLRKQYPQSEFQVQAHVLGLQAKLRMYQGAAYDGASLAEASEISETALTQFNRELGPEKERMLETSKAILDQKAQREWTMGQYYEKKRHYGASRMYYNNIVKEYPLTPTADLARKRLEEIKDYPDVPVNHFKWLTQILDPED